jgi:hypothetical protein
VGAEDVADTAVREPEGAHQLARVASGVVDVDLGGGLDLGVNQAVELGVIAPAIGAAGGHGAGEREAN